MSRRTIALIVVVAVAILVYLWWPSRPSRPEQLAAQATTPAQVRLWKDVASRGAPPGLDRLPIVRSVDVRRPPAVPAAAPLAPGQSSLAPGVDSGVRVISDSVAPTTSFGGLVTVSAVNGERITLSLGPSTLVVAARLGGKPLSVAKGEQVRVAFESRASVFERREVLALQTLTGALVASAFESADARVTMTVGPPLNLTATQSQKEMPVNGALRVTVRIGKTEVTMTPGDKPQSIEGVFVKLIGSVALPASAAGDASPYAIDLVAWRPSGK
jgi:hypothetical protein